jgi:CheY-like chemotaxis protein
MNANAQSGSFGDLTVMVVEDETIVAFLVEDMLTELGCREIMVASGVAEALALLGERRPGAAVLDVNLAGELAYPVAERLDALQIPFLFATGYGRAGIPAHWAPRPVIQKPFTADTLATALSQVLKA